jgi:hypothetical protein
MSDVQGAAIEATPNRPHPSAGGREVKGRRTHSVHETRQEAVQAAHDLGRLMNGFPFGYVFAVQPKMGKWAFVSVPSNEVLIP